VSITEDPPAPPTRPPAAKAVRDPERTSAAILAAAVKEFMDKDYVAIRSPETKLNHADHDPVEGVRELALFTWRYFIEHPEFLSLLQTENMMKARHLKRSARIFDLHSPLVAVISDLLKRGAATGVFRADADPVKVYVSIASLGAFYLSNRYTLSTIFRRELTETKALAEWGDHIAHMILASLRP
jgi:hypothetical protein